MRVLRLLAVVVVVLGPGIVQASASPHESARREARPATARSVGFLGGLGHLFTGFFEKAGCGIDPLGHCMVSTPTADAGCRIDPLGGCLPDH
jgi:hypothetical protein